MEYGENLYKLKNSDKTSFKTPIEANIMPALSSKRPEEREFVVDSGASMHIMSKKEKSSEEMDTLRRFRTLTVVLTANGEVHTHEEAQVFVQDLNLFVTVQVLEETTAVLSLGKLCEDHGYSYEWESGQKPRLTKDGKSIICKTDNFVPLVVQGLSAKSGSVSSSTSPSQDSLRREVETATANSKRFAASSSSGSLLERSDELAPRNWCDHPKTQNKNKKRDDRKNSDDPLADHLEWLEEFKENLVDRIACIRTQFSELRSGTFYESVNNTKEAQYLYSLPERPKLRSLLANQYDKNSLQKTHWRSFYIVQKSFMT